MSSFLVRRYFQPKSLYWVISTLSRRQLFYVTRIRLMRSLIMSHFRASERTFFRIYYVKRSIFKTAVWTNLIFLRYFLIFPAVFLNRALSSLLYAPVAQYRRHPRRFTDRISPCTSWSKVEKYFTKHFAFDPTRGEDECTQMRATSAMQLRHTSIPRTCCASFISVLIRSMSVKPAISRRTVDKVDRY